MSGGTLTYENSSPAWKEYIERGTRQAQSAPAHEDNARAFLFHGQRNSAELPRRMYKPGDREALGLTLEDLFTTEKRESGGLGEIVARYNYLDESGRFLYQKTRWKRQDGKKSFTWSHKDSAREMAEGTRGDGSVLYNLPHCLNLQRRTWWRGKKDVETLKAHGLAAASPA